MANRTAFLSLLFSALSACTITIQTAPQPATGYYAPVVAPVAAAPRPIYERPAARPSHSPAAPIGVPAPVTSHTPAAAPSPPISAIRPPTVGRGPVSAQAARPELMQPTGAVSTHQAPTAAAPPIASAPAAVATPPLVTPSPSPYRRPVPSPRAEKQKPEALPAAPKPGS